MANKIYKVILNYENLWYNNHNYLTENLNLIAILKI